MKLPICHSHPLSRGNWIHKSWLTLLLLMNRGYWLRVLFSGSTTLPIIRFTIKPLESLIYFKQKASWSSDVSLEWSTNWLGMPFEWWVCPLLGLPKPGKHTVPNRRILKKLKYEEKNGSPGEEFGLKQSRGSWGQKNKMRSVQIFNTLFIESTSFAWYWKLNNVRSTK